MVVEDGTADDDDNDERMTEEREVALDGGGKFKEDLAPLHPRRTSQRASQPARARLVKELLCKELCEGHT